MGAMVRQSQGIDDVVPRQLREVDRFTIGMAEFDQLGQGAGDNWVRPIVGVGQLQPGMARAKSPGVGIAFEHSFQVKSVCHALNRAFFQPGT